MDVNYLHRYTEQQMDMKPLFEFSIKMDDMKPFFEAIFSIEFDYYTLKQLMFFT